MALHLVIHRTDGTADSARATAIRAALRDAVWEVAESHWAASDEALLVCTDLSAAYLLSHFRRGLAQRGHAEPGMLMVVPLDETAALHGLPEDAAAWIAEMR